MKKKIISVLFALVVALGFSLVTLGPMATPALAAATGDYRSAATGDWGTLATWERWNGSAWVTPTAGQGTPTSASGVITILNGHTVTVTAPVTIDQTTVDAGGQITVNSGTTLTVANGSGTDLAVNGTVLVNGSISATGGSRGGITLTVGSGGTLSVPGTMTVAKDNSTMTVSGTLSVTGTLTWGNTSPSLTISSGGGVSVSGTLNLSGGNPTLAVNSGGNLNITGGNVSLASVSTLNVSGTITMSGASTLSVSRGNGGTLIVVSSGGQISMSDTANIYGGTQANAYVVTVNSGGTLIMGPSTTITGGGYFTLASGALMSIGSTAGITSSGATGNIQVFSTRTYNANANYTYDGTSAQVTGSGLPATLTGTLTIGNIAGVSLSADKTINTPGSCVVNSGALLTMGTTVINGTGAFTLSSGGTLGIGSTAGITSSGSSGNIQTTTRHYDTGANYTYNGTAAQNTGNGLPATVNNLTISNTAGVSLTNGVTVNGILALTSGDLTTGANTLTMGTSATNSGNYDVVGAVKRTNPTAGAKTYGSTYTSLNFGVAVAGDVIVTLAKTAPSGFTKYVNRTYALSKPAGAGSADVRLHYRSPEDLVGSPVESALVLWRYDAGSWVLQGRDEGASGSGASYVQKNGVSTFSSWAITVVNQAPVANNDAYSTNEDTTLNIAAPGVLGNDTDAESNPLTAVLDSSVSHGTLTLNSNGSFSYTPNANWNGDDTFTYHANDGSLDSNVATVTITVTPVNEAPTDIALSSSTVDENKTSGTEVGTFSTTDPDPGDTHTYSLVAGTGDADNSSFSISADKLQTAAVFDYETKSSYSIRVRTTDSATGSLTYEEVFTITVNDVNEAPVVTDIPNQTVAEGGSFATINLDDYVTDVDNTDAEMTWTYSGNIDLTVSIDASWVATIGIPSAEWSGAETITFRATDPGSLYGENQATFTVTAVNDAPVAVDDAYNVDENTTLTVDAPGVLGNDSDPDGDALTAVLVDDVSNGTLTLNADGSFTYTPDADFNGTDNFTYKANDGSLDSNVATVTISVNGPPVAVNDAYNFDENTTLSVDAPGVLGNDTDPDGDALTAVLVDDVSNGTLTLNPNGSFTYTPDADFNGTDIFTYKANDGSLDSNVAAVFLTKSGITVSASKTETTSSGDDTVNATTVADTVVDKSGDGTPTITVAKYSSNPGTGFTGDTGKYIDVHIDYPTGVDEIVIKVYYTNAEIAGLVESSLRLRWWNSTSWVNCSDSGVNTTDIPGPPPYSGYMWAKIRDNTTPTLAQLTGTVFGGGGTVIAASGGWGGGGGLPAAYAAYPVTLALDMQGNIATVRMTKDGVLYKASLAKDTTGKNTLQLDSGTKVIFADNTVPLVLRFHEASVTPPAPANTVIIGPVYELNAYSSTFATTPSPITISPPARLILTYEPDKLPKNTSEVFIANYHTEEGWLALTSVPGVAAEAGRVHGLVNRLSLFAVLAKIAAPAPAKFEVSNLTVSPSQAQLNQEVAISVNVANTGGTSGSYNLELKVNGISKSTKQVTVAAGTSQTVNFTITGDAAGKHQVEVAGLAGEFEITKAAKQPQINWWLIGGIIAAIILALVTWMLMRWKRFSG